MVISETFILMNAFNQVGAQELERQINSFYYERLLSSQDKDLVE
jgi:predicted nuclease of restriction endonuclease-like (RecB) superfamily